MVYIGVGVAVVQTNRRDKSHIKMCGQQAGGRHPTGIVDVLDLNNKNKNSFTRVPYPYPLNHLSMAR